MADLARDHRCVAPDQRGFAASDKPEGVEQYRTDLIVADAIALADALSLERFTLVGHDWGGAVAWATALKHPDRVARLVIVNAPHPLVFQRSLIEDRAQREASQYIRAFRYPGFEKAVEGMGYGPFFDKTFGAHADLSKITPEERETYIRQWSEPGTLTAMLNWYRATDIVVPAPEEEASLPLWTHLPFPKVTMPTLVIWGLKDGALLPVQLGGLDALVDDLRIVTVPEAGHFVPWEQPEPVSAAMRAFLSDSR